MNAAERYIDNVCDILRKAAQTQGAAMEEAAACMAEATEKEKNIFAFGCSHAALLALELYYRTGGMVTINPIKAPGLILEIPHTLMTSDIERLEGYGRVIAKHEKMNAGDVIIIHSVSGRNPVTIDMAMYCKDKGMKVIVLTNMNTTTAEASRHSCGKNLYEFADILIDNCGAYGDASIKLEGFEQKVAPTSTAVGAALLNAIVARTVELLLEKGITPPVFVSANVKGGDEHNARILEKYKEHVFYM